MLMKFSFLLNYVNSDEFLTCFEWICVDMCCGVCLGRRWAVFSFLYFPFLLLCWILIAKMSFLCAPSGGKILNWGCCFPCIFHLCWGWVIHILVRGGGGGGLLRGLYCVYIFALILSLFFLVDVFKIVVWMLRFFGSIFLLFGWFQLLIMNGWFLPGIVLIFLALCFPVFFGKRYFIICRWYSLYKNFIWWVSTAERTGCSCSFLS